MNNSFSKLNVLKINKDDNIVVALTDLDQGVYVDVDGEEVMLQNAVKAKHKFVIKDIVKDENVIMYGLIIGTAKTDLVKGEVISTENVSHKTSKISERVPMAIWNGPDIEKWKERTFLGYHRKDGLVGTANYWIVFPLVFCENKYIEILNDIVSDVLGLSKYENYRSFAESLFTGREPDLSGNIEESDHRENNTKFPFKNVDGVRFITHPLGCGGTRQDAQALCGLLAGYLVNPNVAGATVLSLGCQNAEYSMLLEEINNRNKDFDKPIFYIDHQTLGSEEKLITNALHSIFDGLKHADKIKRKPASLSKLIIGLKCGGSDGFSGISANPGLGKVSDIIVKLGGSTILSEFPELCGVEQDIINRCTSDIIASKFLDLMRQYEKSALASGSSFDMNPSPGNIKDGLITDAMKSAGAAKKGGSAPISDVLDYPELLTKNGLNLLCTPGNDVESTTAMVGSGANIILFTTGLGTPTGNPIVPVVKVSSNSQVATKMKDIIDFDTGQIINGKKNLDEIADDLMELIIDVASGYLKTKAVKNQQYDFIPWKRGVSL